uniref:Uncharacterized protein n=1 Tax=Rhodnius prolixus TaxID=13249 RepID=T1HPV5_RHOPR
MAPKRKAVSSDGSASKKRKAITMEVKLDIIGNAASAGYRTNHSSFSTVTHIVVFARGKKIQKPYNQNQFPPLEPVLYSVVVVSQNLHKRNRRMQIGIAASAGYRTNHSSFSTVTHIVVFARGKKIQKPYNQNQFPPLEPVLYSVVVVSQNLHKRNRRMQEHILMFL